MRFQHTFTMRGFCACLCWLPLFVLGLVITTDAQTPATSIPRSVVTEFSRLSSLGQLQSTTARNLLCEEALSWQTPSFGNLSKEPDAVVPVDEANAVARLQWTGEKGFVTDFYFYLRRESDKEWKICAMRTLALTGIIQEALQELQSVKNPSAEEIYQRDNAALTLSTDAHLRAWFLKNQIALEEVRKLMTQRPVGTSVAANDKDQKETTISTRLRALKVSVAETLGDGDVDITIGGITDNAVGFLYKVKGKPPRIDPMNTSGWSKWQITGFYTGQRDALPPAAISISG